MQTNFGLVCSMKTKQWTTNKSFRLKSLTKQKLLQTVAINLEGLQNIVHYCKQNGISRLRLGNAIVPFASHEAFDSDWWIEIEEMFAAISPLIKQSGVRLSMHPGQFIQLGSSSEKVVQNSLKELIYCDRILQLLQAREGVICLHIGARGKDPEATKERFEQVFKQNSWLGRYLALENDENNFDARQTLDLCNACGIAFIFDIFHHSINPSKVSWQEIKDSWGHKRPKLHISSQGNGPVGMHAEYITPNDYAALLDFVGNDCKDIDVMVEAKAKECAIAKLKDVSG